MAVATGSAPLRRFTVAEYYRMAEVGILAPEERVELLDGEIIQVSPIGSRHAACVDRINRLLIPAQPRAIVRVQGPIRLDDHSEPEPDLALLRPRPDFFATGHPGPADVFLIVEVMDTSAASDRTIKLALYARSGIAEVWLVDLNRGLIEVHRHPSAAGFGEVLILQRGQTLAPLAFPDLVLAVDAILG